jgi:hypothetical protein
MTVAKEAGHGDDPKKLGRYPETGQFLEGHEGVGGRPPGSQNNRLARLQSLLRGHQAELLRFVGGSGRNLNPIPPYLRVFA